MLCHFNFISNTFEIIVVASYNDFLLQSYNRKNGSAVVERWRGKIQHNGQHPAELARMDLVDWRVNSVSLITVLLSLHLGLLHALRAAAIFIR